MQASVDQSGQFVHADTGPVTEGDARTVKFCSRENKPFGSSRIRQNDGQDSLKTRATMLSPQSTLELTGVNCHVDTKDQKI